MVVGGVLYSVIEAAATTTTAVTEPMTRPFQDTMVFLGATSVVCSAGSAGTVLNVAVAMPAWGKGVTAATGGPAPRRDRRDVDLTTSLDEARTPAFEWQRGARQGRTNNREVTAAS